MYPLARGLAPVLVPGVAATALGVRSDADGVGAIAAGVLLVRGFRRPGDVARRSSPSPPLVDAKGVRHAAPLPLPRGRPRRARARVLPARRARGRAALRREAGAASACASLAMFGAYVLVLAARERAAAAPVAAVRETRVVIAAALAAVLLS